MRLGNRTLSTPEPQILVFEHGGDPIVFKAVPVIDRKPFDAMYPEPEAPHMTYPGNRPPGRNYEDSDYKAELVKRNSFYIHWLILETLKATPELVWETVDYSKIETLSNYAEELKTAGFNLVEIDAIRAFAINVNSIDHVKMEEAKKRFLASMSQKKD